jgi:hypothetical protein
VCWRKRFEVIDGKKSKCIMVSSAENGPSQTKGTSDHKFNASSMPPVAATTESSSTRGL